MDKTDALSKEFTVRVFTSVPEMKPLMDELNPDFHTFPDDTEVRNVFGAESDKIRNFYMENYVTERSIVNDTLFRAIQENFDVFGIGVADEYDPDYLFDDKKNNLVMVGCMRFEVGLEIPHDPSGRTRGEAIRELAKVVESTLTRLEDNSGIMARCSDMLPLG